MDVTKIVKLALQEYHSDKFQEALKLFKKALTKTNNKVDKATLYRNIGLCHYSMLNFAASEISFKKAVELAYHYANWELCLSQLQMGKKEGVDLYSFRYFGDRNTFPNLPIKKINTIEDIQLANKILVLNEQGFGDEIFFSRGLKLLKDKKFNYQVYPEMLELFKNTFTGNFFTERSLSKDFVFEHDYWIPSGDLFKLLTLSGDWSELKIKSEIGKKNRVGICFSSNPKAIIANKKSVNYEQLKSILLKFDLHYVSLQYGLEIDFAENPKIDNFWNTKKVIDDLDLVITVDTAVANLAAAMNKKVILLINKHLDWRWILNFWSGDIQKCRLDELENKLKYYMD